MLCSGKRVFATCLPIRRPNVVPAIRHRRPARPPPAGPMDEEPRHKDRPLFVVVGCTGTGKTKLGVRLAEELDGEVVSADSIQVYKGLDVATNKATEEEKNGVPHHMMGTVDWGDECNVHQYRNEALKIIDDIHRRGKVPVVVGGTSYYIESLVYDNLVWRRRQDDDGQDEDSKDDNDDGGGGGLAAPTLDAFREYALFRHVNDAPTADTADGAGRMYEDALSGAVRFARTMPAVGRLSRRRYRYTFAPATETELTAAPAECEAAALFAHGVRVLDAALAAVVDGSCDAPMAGGPYEVLVADAATAGHRDRPGLVDVRRRLDALLRAAADRGPAEQAAVRETLCRACAEVERRAQRLALALLADDENTAVALITPAALKAHAAYFDPVTANSLHPHNTRKVFRTIQIHLIQGKQKSQLLEEQRVRVIGSDVPVIALRFKEVHMMWLSCNVDVLHRRLEARTDEMVKRGLVDELCSFKNELIAKTGANNFSMDFTKGVLQCIGVKQFQQYLELSKEKRQSNDGLQALDEALATMKCVTKKYARQQTRWIKNRFLTSNDKQPVTVYRLDCTDLGNWQQLSDQAVDLAKVVLGRKPRDEHTLKPVVIGDRTTAVPVYGEYYCDGCSRLFSNDIQYNIHMASKKHVLVMKKRKRKLQDAAPHGNNDGENTSNSRKKS